MTFKPYQESLFASDAEPSISSSEDSLVKTSQQPEKAPEFAQDALAFGGKCGELSRRSSRRGSSLRMSLLSGLEGLTRFSLHWRRLATSAGRSWWVLGRSDRLIDGIESGLWATPRRNDDRPDMPGMERRGLNRVNLATQVEASARPTPNARDWKDSGETQGERHSPNLGTSVHIAGPQGREKNNSSGNSLDWHTPTSRDWHPNGGAEGSMIDLPNQVMDWPTVRATDSDRGGRGDLIQAAKGNSNSHFGSMDWPTARADSGVSRRPGTGGRCMQEEARKEEGVTRGSLNPRWVLQLMGYPADWLDGIQADGDAKH